MGLQERSDPLGQSGFPGAGRINEKYERFLTQPSVEAEVVELGLGQHAVFGLDQLRATGLSSRTVQQRTEVGRLHRIHQCVYSLVPKQLLTRDGLFMAAVLACGPDAWLSHRSCGVLRGLIRNDGRQIDVTIPSRSRRRHSGVYVHRSTTLAPEDFSVVNAIPCTSLARTLFDLAEVLPRRQLERAFDQAEQMQVFDLTAINDQLERNPTRPAAAKVKSLLAEHYVGSTPTDSMFEDLLIPLLRAAGLPMPEVQAYIILNDGEPPMRRDFVWREQRVNVETDGRKFHATAQAWERDRHNDFRLTNALWRVLRITWRELERDPQRVIAAIARLLGC